MDQIIATLPVPQVGMQAFEKNRRFYFLGLAMLTLLISSINYVVACSTRVNVDRHTYTHTQDNYCSPHCVRALRVKNWGGEITANMRGKHSDNMYRCVTFTKSFGMCKSFLSSLISIWQCDCCCGQPS